MVAAGGEERILDSLSPSVRVSHSDEASALTALRAWTVTLSDLGEPRGAQRHLP